MRILTVIGARPQFIKAAAVSRAFGASNGIQELLVHTGQHHDIAMSDVFFDELNIPKPAYHLGIAGGSHGEMTGRMLMALERVINAETPNWVLVYGDTNSTLAAALAAAKLCVPVAHIEAGLRSFNKRMPEEINRVLTDHCSEILFSPTSAATRNLQLEGVCNDKIEQVGDVMFDAIQLFGSVGAINTQARKVRGARVRPYVLATVHRQENTDSPERLAAIVDGLALVSEQMPVIFPLHPRTRKSLIASGLDGRLANVKMLDPVGYIEMIGLQNGAAVIATDSGGVQKEAFFHGVPCVTMREETEWTELIDSGWNRLAPPTGAEAIKESILAAVGSRGKQVAPYGAGDAAKRIVARILKTA